MIILEGPDKCGKSSVAKVLRELLPGWSYRHHTKPPMEAFGYFASFMADSHRRVIVDRFHPSEPIYGAAYRGKSELSPREWMFLELMSMAQGAIIVLMTDSLENIKGRWGEDDFSPAGIDSLHAGYKELAYNSMSRLTVLTYEMPELLKVDSLKPTTALEQLAYAEVSRCKQMDAEGVLPPSIGMGSLAPGGYMVVAEQVHVKGVDKGPDIQVPFGHGTAMDFLWDTMESKQIDPYHGYYTNASDFADAGAFRRYCDQVVRPSKIVTLGRLAGSLVQSAKPQADIVELQHPLYVKRFGAADQDKWQDQLEDALRAWKPISV